MKAGTGKAYEFGPYRLIPSECRLLRDDQEIRLRPKLFELLTILIENRGHMVEKKDLINRLWPDSIVEDNNLSVSVNALRSILGSEPYIETVSKRGYRFTSDVSIVDEEIRIVQTTNEFDPPGGALPLNSRFYVNRPVDQRFCAAINHRTSIVLVKGARQVGKTSLLARGLTAARQRGATVVVVDFQQFSSTTLESADRLLPAIAELIAYQGEISARPEQKWSAILSPSSNLERFIRREVFGQNESDVVLALDEVDRLFNYDYASEVFGLFRSWHNLRALDPGGPWNRLTLAMAYATEAHLFITDLNQSPFNVGTRLTLDDFVIEQVAELNGRYGQPLRQQSEVARLHNLVGGHPYLTQRGLFEIASGASTLDALETSGESEDGPFGDHLSRMLVSLEQDEELLRELRGVLKHGLPLSKPVFGRLRSGGILTGESPNDPKFRCALYFRYLKRNIE